MKDQINYYFGYQIIPEASGFKYFGIITGSDLNWTDDVNYTLRKPWKALHFIMRILKQGNNNKERLTLRRLMSYIYIYIYIYIWSTYS